MKENRKFKIIEIKIITEIIKIKVKKEINNVSKSYLLLGIVETVRNLLLGPLQLLLRKVPDPGSG